MLENTNLTFASSFAGQQSTAGKFGVLWCDLMHDAPMWPIHGRYQCRTCGRCYAVPWEEPKSERMELAPPHIRRVRFTAVLVPLAIALGSFLASPARAGDAPIVESTEGASLAFARYTANLEQAAPWRSETIDIEASLPKLKKAGRLRAIRHLLPFGKPEYQVLEIAGDQTVKQQVIVRYLNADVQAAAIPASTVAITPENYRFQYKGELKTGTADAYVFSITPRKKREGLIKGELWIDSETGAVLRQSGYLVKKSSIFVKRIDVTREMDVHDGVTEMRVTHLTVDTRLAGRAELTIREYPYFASTD
jgi:hypothetical protein